MRHVFGGSPADYAMEKVGNQLLLRPYSIGDVWDAATGGTQLTDLTDLTGSPITQVTADNDGAVAFYGPDGVTSLYVDFGYGRRYALPAVDTGAALAAFVAQGGTPSGWAQLDGTGHVDPGQIPAVLNCNVVTDPDFGAVGDGVTDDTVAVQAAINAGGITFFPPGTYLVSTLEAKLGMVLAGVTRSAYAYPVPNTQSSTLKLKTSTNGHLLHAADGINNCQIHNLAFDGNKAGNTSGDIIHLDDATAQDTSWHVTDCYLDNAAHDGIFIGSSRQAVKTQRVWIMRSANNGITINGTDAGIDNTLIGLSASNAIYIGAGVQHISNCDMWSSTGNGILVAAGSMINISGCGLDRHKQSGIVVQGGDVTIIGCMLHSNSQQTNNTYPHISVTGGTVNVIGSIFGTDGFTNNPDYAIKATGGKVKHSSNTVVSGSVVSGFLSGITLVSPDTPSFQPSDHGLLAWTYDPAEAQAATAMTGGTVYLAKVNLRQPTRVTNILATVGTAGATLTSGQCFAGLYNSSGIRIAITADQATNWQSIGTKTMALASGPFNLAAGSYYIALLANGTTPPQFIRSNNASASMVNIGLATSAGRYITTETAQTALPSTTNLAGAATDNTTRWAALS